MSEVIDLGAVLRGRAAPPPAAYSNPDEALSAMRAALDTLAKACADLDRSSYGVGGPWADIAKKGLDHRLQWAGARP